MSKSKDKIYMWVFISIIVISNFQLVLGESNQLFYLKISSLLADQYWQLITHPLAHLSLYHLATDLLVFILLFNELKNAQNISIYKIIFFCWIFSSIAAVISMPLYSVDTFGGLSGINYGMLTYICLENYFLKDSSFLNKTGAILTLALLIFKQILEGCFQINLINEMHLGYVGVPIVECHAGGILAALILFLFYHQPQNGNKNENLFRKVNAIRQ